MLANKFDGDCFALVGAHQHGITIHNQDLMRERESGVIPFIIYYYYGGVGKGELGNTKVSIVYSIRMGGGKKELCLGGGTFIVLPLPFCIKPDKNSRGQSKPKDRLPPSE